MYTNIDREIDKKNDITKDWFQNLRWFYPEKLGDCTMFLIYLKSKNETEWIIWD